MGTRKIDGSNAFSAGFNSAVPATAGEKVPFRLPGESCTRTCLVPLFGMVPAYDSDLKELLLVRKARVT